MSDITVSGGGQAAVSTETMTAAAAALDAVSASVWTARQRAPAAMGSCGSGAGSGSGSGSWTAEVVAALAALEQADELCDRLRRGLNEAAERYGNGERALDAAFESTVAALGTLAGFALPSLALAALGALPMLTALTLLAVAIAGGPDAFAGKLTGAAARHQGLLRDPRVVALVRQLISGADNVMLSAAGVAPWISRLLDDRALGWFGLHGAAREVIGLAGPRALKETPVETRMTGTASAAAPAGFAGLAARVPQPGRDGSQVRIERYEVDGERRWIVYVGGTVDLSLTPGAEPWDNTSNVAGVARLDPGSLRATEQAMQAAGIRPGDTVLPVGYSQGGIVATAIAGDPRYVVPALVTFGSPTAGVAVPGVTDVAVEHRDDIVPALGGEPLAPGQGGLDRILVTGLSEDGPLAPDASPVDAHLLNRYAATAAKMDTSHDPRLTGARSQIDGFTGAGTGTATTWRGERVSPGGSAGAG